MKVSIKHLISLLSTLFIINFFSRPGMAVVSDESVKEVHALFAIAYVIVGLTTGIYLLLMLYYLIRYRNSADRKVEVWSLKRQNKFILIWVVLVFGLVGVEAFVEAPVTELITEEPDHYDAVVEVTASKFNFRFKVYENVTREVNVTRVDAVTQQNVTITENVTNFELTQDSIEHPQRYLVLEAGKVYKFNVNSGDVIHSFFIRDLAYRMDAVPGRTNTVFISFDTPGNYEVYCTEFCGNSHFAMNSMIEVN